MTYFKMGDKVRVLPNAQWTSGGESNGPAEVYLATISYDWEDGDFLVQEDGTANSWVVSKEYLELVEEPVVGAAISRSGGVLTAEPDMVNHPPHYKFSNGAEVIDITENLTFNGGNAVKYLARATRQDGKNKGNVLEDLEKARFYVEREIGRVKNA